MANCRRLSAQGLRLSLGALVLAWSLLLPAQQSTQRAGGSVNLRMSDSLGESARGTMKNSASSNRVSTSTGGGGGRQISGARGVSLELTSGLRFDDNIFRTSFRPQRDVIMELEPSFYVDGRLGKHRLRLGYKARLGKYLGFREESYFDSTLLGAIKFDFDRRLKASLKATLEYGHDTRGDIATRVNVFGRPDRWRQHNLAGEIIYGRRIAKAQIGLGYDVGGIRYSNNNQTLRDFDERLLRLFGRYNLSPRFTLLSELSGDWFDYLDPASNQSAQEYMVLGGVAWEATVKTSGEILLGLRYRDFSTPGFASTRGLTWDAKVYWAPKSYSKFTAYTSRDVNSSARLGSGGLTSTDTYGLKWSHGLTRNLRFVTGVEIARAEISDNLTDRLFNADAGFRYRINRWVDLRADWKFTSLSSTFGFADYEANSVFIGLDTRFSRRAGRAK